MTIRNLDAIFRPGSIVLIGASDRPFSAGQATMHNLLAAGFRGPIAPVNPAHASVSGLTCYPDVAGVPFAPDLAVICTPPATVPKLIDELGARGTRGAVVITAGFAELGNEAGQALERAMLAAARPHLLRVIGPNCVGVISTAAGLNASFAPGEVTKGGIAFVAQSGGMLVTVLDWARARGIGFSHLVSLGDMADVDFGDMLDYLATDPGTTAILLYIEAVTAPRKFLSAARGAARLKPVIAIKAGRHAAAAKAAASHTGAMAGADSVYDAAFHRAGILRVIELEELLDAVETLAHPLQFSGDSLVILTNGGGPGVIATDALLDRGGELTTLSAATLGRLDAVLPATWSRGNPVDIIGDAPPERYAAALEILFSAPETGAVLVLNVPTAIASSVAAAEAVIRTCRDAGRGVFANWMSVNAAARTTASFAAAGLPAYDTPGEAVRGFMHVVGYRKGQQVILETPASDAGEFRTDEAAARGIIATALARGDSWLPPGDVFALLDCYRISVARAVVTPTPEAAGDAALRFGTPVALKIVSPGIQHKSDVGGVILSLRGKEEVGRAASGMRARVNAKAPGAPIEGYLVQEMITRPGAYELIAGVAVDRQFGPVILFGHGGTAAEIIGDSAIALPPLNQRLARELLERTRIYRQLRGYRDHPPAALDDIALTLVKLSQMVVDLDEVVELDLNPLLADAAGVVVLDARIRIAPPEGKRGARLAIRPYPRELESETLLPTLGRLRIRPIRPSDAAGFAELIGSLTEEDARLRFFSPLRNLEPHALARFTQIDYEREMGFVAFGDDDPGRIAAAAMLVSDPDGVAGEFAIVVRSDLHRRGIGRLVMRKLIDYARSIGLSTVNGDVLNENRAMLALCAELGFAVARHPVNATARAVLAL